MQSIDISTPLTKEQTDSLVNSIAEKIVARRLETPAILFLEMHKPLSFIASQATLVAMPFLAPFLGAEEINDLSKLLRNSENIDLLITRIEEKAFESSEIRNSDVG